MSTNNFQYAAVSVQGHSHKKTEPQVPCQDAGTCGTLQNGFHVMIVSDGAGSSRLSHVASSFCVSTLYSLLSTADFSAFTEKPADDQVYKDTWNTFSKKLFDETRKLLFSRAEMDGLLVAELNCTLILVIKTPWGFLSANIGDGRSGYFDGTPHALTVPFMTFTAGATFFLIKEGWERIFRSYVHVPVAPDQVRYFFASSDGCQDFLIDGSVKGSRTGIYDDVLGDDAFYDGNLLFQPFFDGMILSLKEVQSQEDINERLRLLVEQGMYTLNGETKELKSLSNPLLDDDKTMILFFN